MTVGFKSQLQTLLSLRNFKLRNIRITEFQRKVDSWNSNIFKKPNFRRRDEIAIDEGGGRYCWAITQAAGRSCCGRSGSSAFDFGFHQLDFLVYTYIVDHKNGEVVPAHAMLAYRGSRSIAPFFVTVGARWGWVVNITTRPHYFRVKNPDAHWIRGWVGSRTRLDDLEKRRISDMCTFSTCVKFDWCLTFLNVTLG